MRNIIRTTLLTTLVATALAASPGAVEAHGERDHGRAHRHNCENWLDGRDSQRVPPHCRRLVEELNQVRRATSAFFSFDVGVAAGWDTAISPCVESPMGGMGYHIANMEQLGNGSLSLLRPEVLLYAPTEDGSMEFLGVEYIVPVPAWPHAEPPEILGQALHLNPVQNIWALHVWIGRHNPAGMFADWNPDVSCQFAPPPGD